MTAARARLEATLVGLEYDWLSDSDDVLRLREQVEDALREATDDALERAARTAQEVEQVERQRQAAAPRPESAGNVMAGNSTADAIRALRRKGE